MSDLRNTIDVPSPQPAEPSRRTYPDDPGPEIMPRPGVPIPEITNPIPGMPDPQPAGPEIVPPGVPFIQ